MNMQNFDFTMILIPGKENATGYMTRQALLDCDKTGIEKNVRAVTQDDHAVVLEYITHEAKQDAEIQHPKLAMQTGVWDKKIQS